MISKQYTPKQPITGAAAGAPELCSRVTFVNPCCLCFHMERRARTGTNSAGTEAHVQPSAVAHTGYVKPSYEIGPEYTIPSTSTVWRTEPKRQV